MSPALPSLAAVLTRPSVTVANKTRDALPLRRVIPLGHTPFPSGICSAAVEPNVRFACSPPRNAQQFEALENSAVSDSDITGDVICGPTFLDVLPLQPRSIVPSTVREIVTGDIAIPPISSLIPRRALVAAARAEWWCADRQIANRLVPLASVTRCCSPIARRYALLREVVIDGGWRNAEFATQRLRSAPTAIWERRGIALGKIARLGFRQLPMGIAFGHEGGDARLCVSCG